MLALADIGGVSSPDPDAPHALARPIAPAAAELVGRRLAAISQPVRIRLIDVLDRRGETRVQVLAEEVGISLTDASQHLAFLLRAGVVRRRREGRHAYYELIDREAVHIYNLVAEQLRHLLLDAERKLAS